MKDVILNKNQKNNEKVFTKKKGKHIIREDYKPSDVDNKLLIYKRRSGLYMEEVLEKLNFLEKIFLKKKFIEVYKKGIKKGFNWSNNVR